MYTHKTQVRFIKLLRK